MCSRRSRSDPASLFRGFNWSFVPIHEAASRDFWCLDSQAQYDSSRGCGIT